MIFIITDPLEKVKTKFKKLHIVQLSTDIFTSLVFNKLEVLIFNRLNIFDIFDYIRAC